LLDKIKNRGVNMISLIIGQMLMLSYLTIVLLSINEFFNSVLITFLSNFIFEGITIIFIIHLATRAKLKGALDVTAKVVGIAAGSTIIHKN
jgi:hypothetical protein